MLIIFKSKAAGDVIMFGDVGKRMLEVMGKEPGERGIITVEQLGDALARLRQAMADDKARAARASDDDQPRFEQTTDGGKREFVNLFQRAAPLAELLDYALKAGEPVTWGV